MDIKLLDNADELRKNFVDRFVLSWEKFQIKNSDFIDTCSLDVNWYNEAYLWDKLNFDFSDATFYEALSALKAHTGNVLIMSEGEMHDKPGELFCNNERITNFVARVNGEELAKLIEEEWFKSYELFVQDMYDQAEEDLLICRRHLSLALISSVYLLTYYLTLRSKLILRDSHCSLLPCRWPLRGLRDHIFPTIIK